MHRTFVEKKPGHDAEARRLLEELCGSLGIEELEGVRILQRYDIDGLGEAEFATAAATILSEPQIDTISATPAIGNDESAFAVEYLPGQFDQRADSAAQCIQILTGGERPQVRCAKVIVLTGNLRPESIEAAKSQVINPVDSHEVEVTALTAAPAVRPPDDVALINGFTTAKPGALRDRLGLAMSLADVAFCQSYFRDEEHRDPTLAEIRVLDTYWSDHCRHTTFHAQLANVTFDDGTDVVQRAWQSYLDARESLGRSDAPVTLMDIALTGMRVLKASGVLDNLEESDEINAASIVVHGRHSTHAGSDAFRSDLDEDWLVMFKNETHNHPTEIEPFGGAATCLGGCIRDPLSGRAYVYQAMRVTGAGDPRTPFSETLPGKLPQKTICRVAAQGYSSYGNQIGLATGQVAELYHPGYVAKRMEIGAVVAAAARSQVVRGKPSPGDVILLIGGRTGRDGVGGATGSSKEHNEHALSQSAEVQKGDAPTERKIQRLFRHPEVARRIKVCNDFGAGGVSVAIGEIAHSLDIDLDAVPKKYEGLDGIELAISESQERMAVCIDPKDADFFIREADRENLECTAVAKVTDTGRLVMRWRGSKVVDLSRAFLDTSGVQQTASVYVARPTEPQIERLAPDQLAQHLASLGQASQRGLGEMFDASVGAGSVLWPFGGRRQLTPPDAMAAKLPVLNSETTTCTVMAWGFDPWVSSASPFHGAASAVAESVCKCIAAGARLRDIRLTLQEYFPKLGDDPARWGLPFASLLGAFHAQQALGIAAIGGKDSMSGTFNDLDVPPTLVSFALAPADARLVLSPEFKRAGSAVSLVKTPVDRDGLPEFEWLKTTADALHRLNRNGKLESLHHVGNTGIAGALAKMAFGNRIGFQSENETMPHPEKQVDWMRPARFSFLIEHDAADLADIREALPDSRVIGRTTDAPVLDLGECSHALDALLEAWESTLEPIYPTKTEAQCTPEAIPAVAAAIPCVQRIVRVARPRVVIPAFPGTNSEYDSARAFERAGADPSILVFRNLSADRIDQSLAELADAIRRSQILMIPGGFSAGDEPDGSAKFIAAVIRSPRVADAITELIEHRDGLILGICNGFQALIKTGLVPDGRIRDASADAPTLVHNTIGRHVSRQVRTRVASKLSPWLSRCEVGDIHTLPVSHGEGRFLASEAELARLAANGQIATQYVDADGRPSMEIPSNPNGSVGAVEGITSPCGRVFGKMAHTERTGTLVAKNIPGSKEQPLFDGGVGYFTS
jgi:phosphoribosylformylglycinamidine synthase